MLGIVIAIDDVLFVRNMLFFKGMFEIKFCFFIDTGAFVSKKN